MVRLCVNIDHVATLRQARRSVEPDPVYAAVIAELAGVHGITLHLREDRRHVQDRDLKLLKELIKVKINLEMAAVAEIAEIALKIRPNQATLVPERREELTTEGGLDVAGNFSKIADTVRSLRQGGIEVSLFIDPDARQVQAAARSGADAVEINTARYSESKAPEEEDAEFQKVSEAVRGALGERLVVHAGHGLNYTNVGRIANIKGISELNIGHSIVARSVFVGFERAVREMLALMEA